jgi:exopolyphosphatase/guanosine-5'-triphosphate,3'-diphosphate pyrophosphatase
LVATISRLIPNLAADALIVTGGNTRSLLNITHHTKKVANYASLGEKDLRAIEKKISGVPPEKIAEHYGISDHYAAGLEPCCIFIDKLLANTFANKATIVVTDTRSVVLRDMLLEIRGGSDEFEKDILTSARFTGEKYSYDAAHAEHVRSLALSLFDKTAELHRLTQRDRLLLDVAAILHDVGQFIDTRQHHKHSMYLVANTQIPGLSSREIRIVSLIVRYHRKAMPRRAHPEYASLPEEERMRVASLAAILRVADALDRSHDARVAITSVSLKGKNLNLGVASEKDLSLDMLSLKRKKDLFQNQFCVNLKVVR